MDWVGDASGGRAGARALRGVLLACVLAAAAGCSSRPYGDLIVGASAPGTTTVDMLVATTRAPVLDPPGVIFGGARGRGLRFVDIAVSIPPDSARQAGEVQWPRQAPGDPTRDFVTLRVDRMELAEAKVDFNSQVLRTPSRKVLIFVHGYNTRFEEAVYGFAQIVHDADVDVVPVLFTWPSGGSVLDYVYDRDSAMYSAMRWRRCFRRWSTTRTSGRSRSSPIRWATTSRSRACARWRSATAACPRRSTRSCWPRPTSTSTSSAGRSPRSTPIRARPISRSSSRATTGRSASRAFSRATRPLGSLDPTVEPYSSELQQARINVVDLTKVQGNDFTNHSKFASSEVVAAIGTRLAQGQTLTDSKPGLVEAFGAFAKGAVSTAADVAVAPTRLGDPTRNEKSVDTAEGATKLDQ